MSHAAPPSSMPPAQATAQKSVLDWLLTLFTDVRAGEAPTALLLMLNVFLLLAAYYILKPVREALILSEKGGAEAKSYLAAAMAIVLVILIPAYSKLVNRIIRSRLITFVTLIFVACLVGFWGLDKAGVHHLGYPFFVWIGIFNVMVVAQFWGFANDVYRSEAGKRLFPIVAFGGNLGAMAGPLISKGLENKVDLFQLLLVAAGILVVCILLTWIVSNRAFGGPDAAPPPTKKPGPTSLFDGFDLLFKHRYLGLIAMLVLLLNLVNTNGEYILGKLIKADAEAKVPVTQVAPEATTAPADSSSKPADQDDARQKEVGKHIKSSYDTLYWWVNLFATLLQLFVAARLVKYGGVGAGLVMLPIISLLTYGGVALVPVLTYVFWGKVFENATDYSVNTSSRKMLFLPTSTLIKYKAQQSTDSFMQRAGDLVSAGVVFLGTTVLAFSIQGFAIVNVCVVALWLVVVVLVTRDFKRLEQGELPELTESST